MNDLACAYRYLGLHRKKDDLNKRAEDFGADAMTDDEEACGKFARSLKELLEYVRSRGQTPGSAGGFRSQWGGRQPFSDEWYDWLFGSGDAADAEPWAWVGTYNATVRPLSNGTALAGA